MSTQKFTSNIFFELLYLSRPSCLASWSIATLVIRTFMHWGYPTNVSFYVIYTKICWSWSLLRNRHSSSYISVIGVLVRNFSRLLLLSLSIAYLHMNTHVLKELHWNALPVRWGHIMFRSQFFILIFDKPWNILSKDVTSDAEKKQGCLKRFNGMLVLRLLGWLL